MPLGFAACLSKNLIVFGFLGGKKKAGAHRFLVADHLGLFRKANADVVLKHFLRLAPSTAIFFGLSYVCLFYSRKDFVTL